MDEVIQAFLEESHENLQSMEAELLQLETRPQDRDLISSMFRTVHTIKGTCGCLGFSRLQALTHAGESLLAMLRDGSITSSTAVTDQLLALLDSVRRTLASIETTGSEGEEDNSRLIERLGALTEAPVEPAPQAHAPPSDRPPTPESPAQPEAIAEPEQAPLVATETSVRVDVGLLDRLLDLVGELVLARNQLVLLVPSEGDEALIGAVRRIERTTDLLQADVMRTRMRPLESVLQMAPRLVRELAQSAGKKIALTVEGGETELDRGMLEAIRDPLVHLLRNSIDHGIEAAAERLQAGKPAEGHVSVRAYHHGGLVTVEVSDDGGGIDPKRLRARAGETGMLKAADAEGLSDQQAMELIFRPGFSTAKEITSVSGRGVGMDVVRVNVEKVGGSVEVTSVLGKGTTVRLRIPLTLAIISALLVEERGERFAIPQVNVQELVMLGVGSDVATVEKLAGYSVFRLRDRLVPLLWLGNTLWPDETTPGNGDRGTIVVVQTAGRVFGIAVDRVEGVQDIVVKPLGRPLNRVPVLAGATVLGDGSLALILDMGGLLQRSGVATEVLLAPGLQSGTAGVGGEKVRRLLVVRSRQGHHAVIPVEAVERLEELQIASVESLPGLEVVQYQGDILPVVRVAEDATRAATPLPATGVSETSMVVVVYNHLGHRTGLVVSDLVDVIEETPTLRDLGRRPGVVGSVVVRGRVAELVDVEALIEQATHAMAASGQTAIQGAGASPPPGELTETPAVKQRGAARRRRT